MRLCHTSREFTELYATDIAISHRRVASLLDFEVRRLTIRLRQ